MNFTNENIYWHGTRSNIYLLNTLLQKRLGFAPTIILIIVFSEVNMFTVGQITPKIFHSIHTIKGKIKQSHLPRIGPESSRKFRFLDFMRAVQDGGKVVSLTHRPPLPQEIHLVLISVSG
jgi:hypothetical protein